METNESLSTQWNLKLLDFFQITHRDIHYKWNCDSTIHTAYKNHTSGQQWKWSSYNLFDNYNAKSPKSNKKKKNFITFPTHNHVLTKPNNRNKTLIIPKHNSESKSKLIKQHYPTNKKVEFLIEKAKGCYANLELRWIWSSERSVMLLLRKSKDIERNREESEINGGGE